MLDLAPSALLAGPHVQPGPGRIRLALDDGADLSALASERYDCVLLHGFAPDEPLPTPLLRDIFSRPVRSIQRLSDDRERSAYRPFAHRPSRVLDIFPGAPIPLDKGANQRAFGLVHHLNRAGIGTDLLLTTSSRRALPRLAGLLSAVAPTVHTYRQNKPLLPLALRARREAERAYRISRGVLASAPDLFVDRLATRSSHDGKRRLAELLATGRYDAVIVNFAWMTGMLDAAREAAPHVKWICDTHDVQFVRSATQNQREPRRFVNAAAERRAELRALDKYDAVLAISESDRDILAKHLGSERVLSSPSGFDYAHQPIGDSPPRPPLTFGFIGRAMPANLLAFERLILEWWPALSAALPGSRLRVAGTLSEAGAARRLARRFPTVELLSFVPSLATFYRSIDLALNPVVVQGGLNFKSLEALAAGRLLITTPMGRRCLGPDAPILVAERADDAVHAVRELMADPSAHQRQRQHAQAWCMERFSEQRAFAPLRSILGG